MSSSSTVATVQQLPQLLNLEAALQDIQLQKQPIPDLCIQKPPNLAIRSIEMESQPIGNQDASSSSLMISHEMETTKTVCEKDIALSECSSDPLSAIPNQLLEASDDLALIETNESEPLVVLSSDPPTSKELGEDIPQNSIKEQEGEALNPLTDLHTQPLSSSLVADASFADDFSEGKHSPLSVASEELTSSVSGDLDEEVDLDQSGQQSTFPTLKLVEKIIQSLRRCRSRTDKPRILRALQKKANLSRQEAVEFLNQAMERNQIERVKYRDYFGIRLVAEQPKMSKPDSKEDVLCLSENVPESMEEESIDAKENVISEEEEHFQDKQLNLDSGNTSPVNEISERLKLKDSKLLELIVDTVRDLQTSSHLNGVDCVTLSRTLETKKSLKINPDQLQLLINQHVQTEGLFHSLANDHYRLREEDEERDEDEEEIEDASTLIEKEKAQTKSIVDPIFDGIARTRTTYSKRKHSPCLTDRSHILEDESSTEFIVNRLSATGKKEEAMMQRGRPASQRKKIKKSLGPDFLDPSDLGYQYLKNCYDQKCDHCSLTSNTQTLVNCNKCGYKVHVRCLEKKNDKVGLKRFKSNDGFLCDECRLRCAVCKSDEVKLFANCSYCFNIYHHDCVPNLTENEVKSSCKWYCPKCILNNPSLEKALSLDCERTTKLSASKLIKTENVSSSSNDEKASYEIEQESEMDQELEQLLLTDFKSSDQSVDQLGRSIISVSCEEDDKIDAELSKSCGLNEGKGESMIAESSLIQIDNTEKDMVEITTDPIEVEEEMSNDRVSISNVEASIDDASNQSSVLSGKKVSNSEIGSQPNDSSDDLLVEQYRKLLPNYDRQREVVISKEEMDNLRALNSYSNGKDPAEWTVEDVETFISEIGFPEQSLLFRKEEIDGKSLLLLRRNDVLTGFSMQLGPALKIYAHIYKLQGSL